MKFDYAAFDVLATFIVSFVRLVVAPKIRNNKVKIKIRSPCLTQGKVLPAGSRSITQENASKTHVTLTFDV